MKRRFFLLRLSYWCGALLDGLMLIPMLIPEIGGAMYGISDFNPGPEYRYAMGVGAALMAGWTVLLIWADRKPVERKGILPITLFPVVVGLVASGIYAVASDLVALDRMIPIWILQGTLSALFLFSWIYSRPLAEPNTMT